MATHGEIRSPSPGSFDGRVWGDLHGRRHARTRSRRVRSRRWSASRSQTSSPMRASPRLVRQTRRPARGVKRSRAMSTMRPARDRSSASASSSRCSGRCRQSARRWRAVRSARSTAWRRCTFSLRATSVRHRLLGETVQVTAADRDVVIMHLGVPVAQHELLPPGEASSADLPLSDAGALRCAPLAAAQAIRARVLTLGPAAEDYLRGGGGRYRTPIRASG